MALSKATLLALAVIAMVAAASVVPAKAEEPHDCFCPCMRDSCMSMGATREECARACNEGCKNAGYGGRPNQYEFCGF